MNALQRVPFFTNSFNILCILHINKNIAKNCKIGIKQEEWDKIMKDLNLVWKSHTKEMFDTNWQAFKSTNQLSPSAITYIEKEWISRQVHFAHYSINKYMHV